MAIEFTCPKCSTMVRVSDNASGKIGRCPKCDARVQVPSRNKAVKAAHRQTRQQQREERADGFYLLRGSNLHGPFSKDQLLDGYRQGKISKGDAIGDERSGPFIPRDEFFSRFASNQSAGFVMIEEPEPEIVLVDPGPRYPVLDQPAPHPEPYTRVKNKSNQLTPILLYGGLLLALGIGGYVIFSLGGELANGIKKAEPNPNRVQAASSKPSRSQFVEVCNNLSHNKLTASHGWKGFQTPTTKAQFLLCDAVWNLDTATDYDCKVSDREFSDDSARILFYTSFRSGKDYLVTIHGRYFSVDLFYEGGKWFVDKLKSHGEDKESQGSIVTDGSQGRIIEVIEMILNNEVEKPDWLHEEEWWKDHTILKNHLGRLAPPDLLSGA